MTRVALVIAGALVGCASVGREAAPLDDVPAPSYATANLVVGERSLDSIEPGAEGLADYRNYGAEGVVLPWPAVPVGLELGATYGSSSTSVFVGPGFGSVDVGLDVLQVAAGLRVYLHRAEPDGFPLEPFLAVGIAQVYADVNVADVGFSDVATGNYLRAGVQVRISRRVHVGLDWRRLEGAEAAVDVFGVGTAKVDFDSDQIGLFVGVRL